MYLQKQPKKEDPRINKPYINCILSGSSIFSNPAHYFLTFGDTYVSLIYFSRGILTCQHEKQSHCKVTPFVTSFLIQPRSPFLLLLFIFKLPSTTSDFFQHFSEIHLKSKLSVAHIFRTLVWFSLSRFNTRPAGDDITQHTELPKD